MDTNRLVRLRASGTNDLRRSQCRTGLGIDFHRAVCWLDAQEAKEELRTTKTRHVVTSGCSCQEVPTVNEHFSAKLLNASA